jgi:hypothetical protein
MKKSTSYSHRIKSLGLLILLAVFSNSMQAAVHYVRTATDATSWSNIPGADIISSDTPTIIPTDIYYFAKGTFTLSVFGIDPVTLLSIPITPAITTGAIYGGFSGSESVINLDQRTLSDKDANGVVEPWEFTNETILKGSTPFDDLTGSRIRLLSVTGGEVNGVTLTDHYYFGELNGQTTPYGGAIFLGIVTSSPGIATDVVENAGKMRFCTVRRLKAGANGPIFMTNSNSLVNNCLIEECNSVGLTGNGGGGAIFMYPFGGTVSNSVLRNNVASAGVPSSGRGGAIYSAYNTAFAIPNKTIIQNCAIYNNTAGSAGGAIRVEGKGSPTANLLGGQIINCTLANNLTQTSGVASAELIFDGQLMVNTIVVGDNKDEIRPQANNNHISNCVYGSKNGTIVMTPGTDLTSGKVTADLKFEKIANFVGAMSPDDLAFDQTIYDAIRSTSLKIVDALSPAVTTTGLNSMPTAFTSNANIIPTGIITNTDLAGVTRTGNYTIGAYQFVPSLATKTFKLNAYAVVNGIVINECLGETLYVYNIAGQLLKKVSIESNDQIINLSKGLYVVSVGNAAEKIIVR